MLKISFFNLVFNKHLRVTVCSGGEKNKEGESKHDARFTLCRCYESDNGLAVNFFHVSDQIENFVRVTDFVVVPRDNFNEVVSQVNTCFSIED